MDHEALAQSAERRLMEHRRRELGAAPSPSSPWTRTREGPNALAPSATLDRSGASLDAAITAWPSDGLIPGAVVTVTLVLANGGAGSAEETVAVVPAPSGAAYRPGTLMHDGREAGDDAAEALLGAGLTLGKLAGGARTALTWKLDIGPGIDDLILAPSVRADVPVVAARPLILGRTAAPSAFKAGVGAELAPPAATVPTTHEDVETPFYELDVEEEIVETALQSSVDTTVEKPPAPAPAPPPAASPEPVAAPQAPAPPPAPPIPTTGRRIGHRAPNTPVKPRAPEPQAAPEPVAAEPAPPPAPEIIKPTPVPPKRPPKPAAPRIVKPAAEAVAPQAAPAPAIAAVEPAPAAVPALAALYRALRPADLGLVEGLLEKPLGLLPHLLFSNLLCVATTGDGGDPLGLAAFIEGESTRMGRLKVAARLGKPLPLDDGAAHAPGLAAATAEIRFADPPATTITGAVLLTAPLDDARIAAGRAALERPLPRWLAFRLLGLVFCAQGLAANDAPASAAVKSALTAYAMQARLAFVAFATRMKLDRRLDPTRTATKTLDQAARTTLAALRAAIGDA